MNDYLTKPIDSFQLKKILEKWMIFSGKLPDESPEASSPSSDGRSFDNSSSKLRAQENNDTDDI
jgi:hypothetical protein